MVFACRLKIHVRKLSEGTRRPLTQDVAELEDGVVLRGRRGRWRCLRGRRRGRSARLQGRQFAGGAAEGRHHLAQLYEVRLFLAADPTCLECLVDVCYRYGRDRLHGHGALLREVQGLADRFAEGVW